jgi:hypothetical protein
MAEWMIEKGTTWNLGLEGACRGGHRDLAVKKERRISVKAKRCTNTQEIQCLLLQKKLIRGFHDILIPSDVRKMNHFILKGIESDAFQNNRTRLYVQMSILRLMSPFLVHYLPRSVVLPCHV